MEYKILLPSAIWQDFDPAKDPFKERLAATSEEGGVKADMWRFSALERGGEDLDVALSVYSEGEASSIVLLTVPEYNRMPSDILITDLIKSGFTVAVPDIAGNAVVPTTFPKEYDYGNFSRAGDHIKKVMPTAKDTSQYLYAVIVKRTAELLKRILPNCRIAAVGLGDAVEVVMQAAGSGTAFEAILSLNSAGYREYIKLNKYGDSRELVMDEERMCWLSGVASVAYAKYITAPVMIAVGTNSEKCDMDRVSNLTALLPGDKVYTVFSPRTSDFLLPGGYRTAKIWLHRMLNGDNFPDCPEIRLKVNEEGKIYAQVDCDPASMIDKVFIYYSAGEYNHQLRNWIAADGIAVSYNEYIATVDAPDENSPLFAFAEVVYENGITLTSTVDYLELSGQPVKIKPHKPSRIVYETSAGLSDFVECYADEVMYLRALEKVTLPSGSKGLRCGIGCMKTYHIDPAFPYTADNLLQIEFHSENAVTVSVVLQESVEGAVKSYTASVSLLPAKGFFTATKFKLTDFKDEKYMPLTSWARVRSLSVSGDGIVIGNILFL